MSVATSSVTSSEIDRERLVHRAIHVQRLSLAWAFVEGALSIWAGVRAHSVALIGFGADSAIELVASAAVFARLRAELTTGDKRMADEHERRALRIVGYTMLLLCVYIAADAGWTLWKRHGAEDTRLGLAVASIALLMMPLLALEKRRLGRAIGSRALVADATESFACAWLAAAALAGVGLHAAFGWWWADPIAGLAMIPLLVREGREALEEAETGQACDGDCCGH